MDKGCRLCGKLKIAKEVEELLNDAVLNAGGGNEYVTGARVVLADRLNRLPGCV